MDAQQLANAAAVYFGGWRNAEHVVTCERCKHDEHGQFVACPAHPARRSDRRPASAPRG